MERKAYIIHTVGKCEMAHKNPVLCASSTVPNTPHPCWVGNLPIEPAQPLSHLTMKPAKLALGGKEQIAVHITPSRHSRLNLTAGF